MDNYDLEEIVLLEIGFGIHLSKKEVEDIISGIEQTESAYLRENDVISELMKKNDMKLPEVIYMLGEAYGKIGMSVDKLPEICVQDTSFLKGYLLNFPIDEKKIIDEDNPEYRNYMELVLMCEKIENDFLIERDTKITQTQALVDQTEGQQQE